MTKKHFKLIAEIIAGIENLQERREHAEHNAKVLASKFPRFNRSKFLAACACN